MKTIVKGTILISAIILLPALGSSWTDYQKERIEEIGEEPTYEQVRTLCELFGSDSEAKDAEEIRVLAWARLQQIPDFPDRIHLDIMEAQKIWRTEGGNNYHYNKSRGWGLYTLGKLPHPRSVKVLGEFLYDDELPGFANLVEAAMNGGSIPNSSIAILSLGRLIEKPPVQGDPENYTSDDIPTWQLWFEQVKAGTRTFRFKGNPQEFNLAGPVSTAQVPPSGRSPAPVPGLPETSGPVKDKTRLHLVLLVVVIALLPLALWTAARRKAALR